MGGKMYKLTIPSTPVGKARPRFGKNGAYTPEKTRNYETLVKELYFTKHGQTMLEGPLHMEIKAYFGIAKSSTKKVREKMIGGSLRPTKRPDIDNVVKSIADALNGVAYADDSQIVSLSASKHYAEYPRVEILIRPLDTQKID